MKKLFLILLLTISLFHTSLFAQWIQQSVPVNKQISSIKFINANTGWACTENSIVGNYCYIFATINGGTNWIIQDQTLNATLESIAVADSSIIYCGGYDFTNSTANLKKTTNSGMNWILIPTPTNMFIDDMVFLNQDSGWACSEIDVRTTTNGGLNWIIRTGGITTVNDRIFFLDYNTGFRAADDHILYKTTNAGLNWSPNGSFPQRVHAICFLDINNGWVGLASGRVAMTTNGGINWIVQQPFPLNTNITSDIYFINNNTGYAGTGWAQKILKTTNGGLDWGYQVIPGGSVKIAVVDTLNVWAAYYGISHTTTGGGNIIYIGINNISSKTPDQFRLYQNYPNPFNPVTKITFDIRQSGKAELIVYDILGRVVNELLNEKLNAGKYEYVFEAKNLPSGVYFYKLVTDVYEETRKMILLN